MMNLPCGSLQPLNELTELKQHLRQTQMELGACANALGELALEGMSRLAIQGEMLEAVKKV